MVMPAFNQAISGTECVACGQCRVFCPTGAISIHTDMDAVWEVLADPEVRVVAQVAPAVRVAVGDAFGLTKAAGTGLVFETMPAVFAHLPGGWFLSAGFFFLLIISGFASGLGLVAVSYTHLTLPTKRIV